METLDCECEKPTSSINDKCVVCGGNMGKKFEKAYAELREYHNSILKEKCKLCKSKMNYIMYDYTTYRYCTNKNCFNHNLPPVEKATPSTSITPTKWNEDKL
jgi:hypothetical protein